MGPSRASLNEEQSDGDTDDAAATDAAVWWVWAWMQWAPPVHFKGLSCGERSSCFCEATVCWNTIYTTLVAFAEWHRITPFPSGLLGVVGLLLYPARHAPGIMCVCVCARVRVFSESDPPAPPAAHTLTHIKCGSYTKDALTMVCCAFREARNERKCVDDL